MNLQRFSWLMLRSKAMIDVLLEIRPLLVPDRLMDVGPGTPNLAHEPLLQVLARELPKKAKNRDAALACLAGLWLLHNFLDESHAVSQDLDTLEGSYWHGILHRREPDYANAKYWFRRAPNHAVFGELCLSARELAAGVPGAKFLARQTSWSAAGFVDLCESAARGPEALTDLCRCIQQREWELLFVHCHERAFGSPGA
jgi:hypothetical protein